MEQQEDQRKNTIQMAVLVTSGDVPSPSPNSFPILQSVPILPVSDKDKQMMYTKKKTNESTWGYKPNEMDEYV